MHKGRERGREGDRTNTSILFTHHTNLRRDDFDVKQNSLMEISFVESISEQTKIDQEVTRPTDFHSANFTRNNSCNYTKGQVIFLRKVMFSTCSARCSRAIRSGRRRKRPLPPPLDQTLSQGMTWQAGKHTAWRRIQQWGQRRFRLRQRGSVCQI